MNKTLLLIVIDFLFLNLIALTRWEKVEPARAEQPPVPQVGANAATKDQDLVDTMRQSLADEQASRQALEQQLAESGTALASREQGLTQKEAERARLAAQLQDTQRTAAELTAQAQAAREESTLTKDQLTQLQRDLEEKRAEADRQRQRLAALEAEQANARKQIQGLSTTVALSEAEKKHLLDETSQLQGEVQAERADRLKVQESAARLAQGVGALAENSNQLTKEIRDNRPINANVLYTDYQANRVNTVFTASRRGLFGQSNRSKQTPTVFVTDGKRVYAVLHIDDTAFSVWQENYDWEKVAVAFTRPPSYHSNAQEIDFLQADPRVVVVPVESSQVSALGAKVYPLASDPFKFPDAVLISGNKGYGELTFKLDPAQPGYVRVDNRFFKRLFGDFAPSRGDLVFSHTGEILGVMVNRTYCALLKDFTPLGSIHTGDNTAAQHTSQTLNEVAARVRSMPPALQ